ncbi:MAG TPA: thiamine pyrophosphate-requiring protein [Burkholderiales bacterium]|nr:thiamine pyrophosphate-requiring protein [Burkholderiales bacterium]
MATQTGAHCLLQGLVELGMEYLFANLGTDHVSIVEALARWRQEGRSDLQVILCPHENVAVHMAGGYAAITGRGQPVLVHVDVGTANSGNALHNLFRSRLPVFVMAGRSPFSVRGELPASRDNYVQFVQDPYDIASLARPYVKWEYTLSSGVVAKEVLRRAQSMMDSDPPGPVYLTLPRETLADTVDESALRSFPESRYGAVAARGCDAAMAQAIAERLIAAENPIAITSYLGRKAEAPAALDALARECGIAVFESHSFHVNIPRDSPCFAGFEPGHGMQDADVGLLLDVDVPWLPQFVKENPRTYWIQVDVDAIKKDFPMWGFPAELRVQADCATVLAQVLQIVRERADPAFRARVAARMKRLAAEREQRDKAVAAAGARTGERGAISPDYVCASIAKAIGADDIVINEAIRNSTSVLNQIPRTRPQTLFGNGGSGLGFSGGMALGVKLARPNRRVVQIVGDGSFHFSTPDSVYSVAREYRLPIFTVVLDNGGWGAVKASTLRVYPKGVVAQANDFQSRLGTERRFEQVAQAFGAHGESVDDPAALEAAIQRCIAAVDGGQSAVLAVKVTPI